MPGVLCVAGARPNFMKIAPILAELERRSVPNRLVHTGQHYDEKMSDVFFDDLEMKRPDYSLGVGSGTHAVQTARIMEAFEPVVLAERPDWVVVVGDVNSTVACSLVAAKLGIDVAHVEAGLRSRDWDMPEEINRVVTDRLSRLLLAPSEDAMENLRAEGCDEGRLVLVGNVMIDSLLRSRARAEQRPIVAELGLAPKSYALATLHRPSNVDNESQLTGLIKALSGVAERMPVVWPVHPRVGQQVDEIVRGIGATNEIRLIDPVGYLDSLALQSAARLIITDSGGVQEESTALGIACLTVRESTERPITVTDGTNTVVGADPHAIAPAVERELLDPIAQRCPELWDGRASARIVDALFDASPDVVMT